MKKIAITFIALLGFTSLTISSVYAEGCCGGKEKKKDKTEEKTEEKK